MGNQERNREALIEHIDEQDRIIRRRNQQIENQARNAEEDQRAIDKQNALNYSLATDLAAAVVRADKAEQERDEWKDSAIKAMADLERAEQPRPLTADDITAEMIERALWFSENLSPEAVRKMLTAALTEPTRPEEKVEGVLRRYWSGDINGDDLADRIVEEMNR